jgi:predicted ATP-grasp superfamily ATP-dependent carboligase
VTGRAALVLDAHLPNAVAGLRALGRAGVRVAVGRAGLLAAGRWSRYAARGRAAGPCVAYPGQETTIDALLAGDVGEPAAELPWDPASLAALRDKRGLGALAEPHGLGAPATLFDGRAGDLTAAGLEPPVVVKPVRATGVLRTARVVASRAALAKLAAELPPDEAVLAQKPVVGGADGRLGSLALVLDRAGAVVGRFQEEVLRTWPREAGSFAASVSVAPDDELVERVAAMLRGAGYWGLAQVDLVRRGGETLILDVNPRFYACMPLALACGVNLPAAWHAVVEGRPAATPARYPPGLRYRWLEGDVYAARHGSLRTLLRPGGRSQAGAFWARDDPLPALLLAGEAATFPLRRRLRSAP